MRKSLEATRTVILATLAVGCGSPNNVENKQPIQQTARTTAEKTMPTPQSQLAELSSRFTPSVLPDNSIQGASAIYDYPGATVKNVSQMEHCGNNTDKVLLTFDDSGSNRHIKKIAHTLITNQTGAIFFPNTGSVKQSIINSLRSQGFWAGNHTATHPNLAELDETKMAEAIQSGGKATLFRPPYGGMIKKNEKLYLDNRVKTVTERLGKRVCIWTISTNDWEKLSAAEINERVLTKVAPGSVILMHMADSYNTLEALPDMIKGIRARGLELCSLQPTPTQQEIPENLPC